MGKRVKEELKINDASYTFEVHQNNAGLPYLLMLHGFMGDGRVFDHFVEDLSEACNPVTIDLLGHGRSEKIYEPERYNEKQQVEDITQLVQRLGLLPVFLYGYSMGGRLALKTVLSAPTLFKGLTLESTNPGIANSEDREKRKNVDLNRAQNIEKDYEGFLQNWEKAALFKSPMIADRKLESKYKKIHLSQDPKAMAASLVGFGTGVMTPAEIQRSKFPKPVMITAGTADTKYITISDSLASQFDNVHLIHIAAGHRVHLDNPKELTLQLTQFIDQNSTL